MNKKVQESFNCFLFLFDEAERIRRANITSSIKQLYWFNANQRRYAWRGNQRVETWCCGTTRSLNFVAKRTITSQYSSSGVIESLNDLYLDLKST